MSKKNKSLGNLIYALKQIWETDKSLLIFTIFKNCTEQVFNVFFFVYLTKYIFNCIERNIEYRKLFIFLVIACSCHVVMHFICGWYEAYRKVKTPEIYRYIFHKVMDISDTLELKDYESPDFYDKYARALDRCVDSSMNIAIKTGVFIGNVLSTIMSLFIVVSVDPILLLFMVVPIIISFWLGSKNSECNFEREKSITREKRITDYVKRVYYEKKYASEIRLYNINSLLLEKQENAVENMEKISLKYRIKSALYSFFMKGSYSIFAGVIAYFFVAFKVRYGNVLDISSYVAMITAMAFSINQLKAAVENRIYIVNEAKLFENLKIFMDEEKHTGYIGESIVVDEINEIELENVSFNYPGSNKTIIKDISFKWKKGDRIAIVGFNGAGKTTLVKLIMGLYPVNSGRILVNGIDLNSLDIKTYRKNIGTVFQDLQVFAMTLAENVLVRSPNNADDYRKVEDALNNAQFDINHRGLTKGMDTMISREFDEKGFVCSGGQAQKIAIARVFAQNPDMVILDEPSSALDPLAEYNMYNNMMRLSENKGVIFISHRISSARMADRIYMMKDGQIIEQGTHNDLIEFHGSYYEMFMLQAKNYQDSIPEEMIVGIEGFYG